MPVHCTRGPANVHVAVNSTPDVVEPLGDVRGPLAILNNGAPSRVLRSTIF
jgi:hypothetical protein